MIRNRKTRAAARAAILLLIAAGAGCAGSAGQKHAEPEFCRLDRYSGFLKDYSRLEPSPTHKGAWYELWTDLPSYDAFIVDPIQMLATTTMDDKPIDSDTGAALGSSLRSEVAEALRISGFRIATEPGPGVARIRGAITELSRSKRRPGKDLEIGGASCEMEITDSTTGQRIAAAVERDEGARDVELQTTDPYFDAKLVFRHWAARLGLWLRGMRGD